MRRNSDVNVDAIDERAHEMLILKTICRTTLTALIVIAVCCVWNCNTDEYTRRVEARATRKVQLEQINIDRWQTKEYECRVRNGEAEPR